MALQNKALQHQEADAIVIMAYFLALSIGNKS
jgi:hypothetical protein